MARFRGEAPVFQSSENEDQHDDDDNDEGENGDHASVHGGRLLSGESLMPQCGTVQGPRRGVNLVPMRRGRRCCDYLSMRPEGPHTTELAV